MGLIAEVNPAQNIKVTKECLQRNILVLIISEKWLSESADLKKSGQ